MMGGLLPTTLLETEEVVAHNGPATQYAGITARTLLIAGARSGAYYRDMNERLAAVMPNARTHVLPRAAHNEACIAGPAFGDLVAGFLTGAPEREPR
jgi:pimeloyl-ACP methyl ester carboxylesterase